MPITETSIKNILAESLTAATLPLFKHVSYIYYLIWLKKKLTKIQALLDFSSKINAITSVYATKLSLKL